MSSPAKKPQKSKGGESQFGELVTAFNANLAESMAKYEVLRNLDFFVLDNSMRESTVGQLRGHTIESKWEIYNEVKKMRFKNTIVASFSHMTRVDDIFIKQLVDKGEDRSGLWAFSEITEVNITVGQLRGHTIESKWEIYNEVKKMRFKNTIVASFSHMTRVDDIFIKQLVDKGEDRSGLWAFSEITEGAKNGVPDTETIPVGLRKLEAVGLYNVIFEIDLGDVVYDFNKFPMSKYLPHLKKLIEWCHDKLHPDAKVLVNFRDLMETMHTHPERVFETVQFLTTLPDKMRLFGLVYEDSGKSVPEEVGVVTKFMRKVMDDNQFNGHLLMHIHEKFGYKDATSLEALMCGANGVWASVCIEGAAMGAASSTITLMNLIRLGNKKVLKKYNCQYLRQAAIKVTQITTGTDPHIKQPIYGERALDFVFNLNPDEFDLAEFFQEKPLVRISTMASPEMIKTRLISLFGENSQFTLDQAYKMKELILEDLRSSRREEYMSPAGLAVLFDRAGGSLTAAMRDVIVQMESGSVHADRLISEVRAIWDTWDAREEQEARGDNMLKYDSFYNGFMALYFGCYRCSDTKKALQAIDMDADNQVDWNEFLVFLKWALHQYPNIKDAQELLDITFRKGIIPAMHDEVVVKQRQAVE